MRMPSSLVVMGFRSNTGIDGLTDVTSTSLRRRGA
jgi:hypothetical protein